MTALRTDFLAQSAQFLSRNSLVAAMLSPHAHVGGNPLNAADPSELIDPEAIGILVCRITTPALSTYLRQGAVRARIGQYRPWQAG